MGNNKPSSLKFAFFTGIGAFFIAVFFSLFSELVLSKLEILILSFVFLLLVIFIGIIFDIVGVAATVAEEKSFHAKATKRIKGAYHAILIVRNADRVATFCNDVIGDICGTVSGALGAAIVFQVVVNSPDMNSTVLGMLMTGLVAGLTVGGKAAGKKKAIVDSDKIIFKVGQTLSWVDGFLGIKVIPGQRRLKGKRRW